MSLSDQQGVGTPRVLPAAAASLDRTRGLGTTPLISLRDIVKTFGKVQALKGVSFDLRPGEVHALLGQNGAGKSTLIKVLAGVTQKDAGTIEIGGETAEYRSPAAARDAGLAVVYQELSLVPSMSVADNLCLAREPSVFGLVQRRKVMREARAFLKDHGLPLRASSLVQDLPFAYRQLTEIAKALSGNVRILVLDEPTSSLSKDEEEILFEAVEQVTSRGVGVIYVTHRLSEVFRLSHRVTVLRDGTNVATFDTKDADMISLVAAIVGPKHGDAAAAVVGSRAAGPLARPALMTSTPLVELKGARNKLLSGIDLAVRPGEVLGLAGMIGSGRSEILETIFGLHPLTGGEIRLEGQAVSIRDPKTAIALGIGLVPEDRHLQGLVLDHSIERNLVLPLLPRFDRMGMFRRMASNELARHAIQALSIKAPSAQSRVGSLSGGNQQKVVFGRWRDPKPKLLLLDEPTVGVDVGAREQIYDVMRDMVRGGAAVLVVSSDLGELLMFCDRIAIVAKGRAGDPMDRSSIDGEEHLHRLVQEAQS
jgi:ribose transport system ATP-binding protein